MNKRFKYKKNNKSISRFRIQNQHRVITEVHAQPEDTYFDKIGLERSLLNPNLGIARSIDRESSIIDDEISKTYQSKISDLKNSDATTKKNGTIDGLSSMNQTKASKFTLNLQKNMNNLRMDPNLKEADQEKKNEEVQKRKERQIYLSYLQYQQILYQERIKNNIIEKLAHKNDRKIENDSKTVHSASQKIKSTKAINLSLQDVKRAQKAKGVNRDRRAQTESSEKKPATKEHTIMGSSLGNLSNTAILRILEQKWHEEQKKRRFQTKIYNDQSEFGSDRDSRSLTNKSTKKGWCIKQKKSELEAQGKIQIKDKGWDVYRKLLERVLELQKKENREEKILSKGEEYAMFQENLMRPEEIYHPKKFYLKHKFDWRH